MSNELILVDMNNNSIRQIFNPEVAIQTAFPNYDLWYFNMEAELMDIMDRVRDEHEIAPEMLLCLDDRKGHAAYWRTQIYPNYKGNRVKHPGVDWQAYRIKFDEWLDKHMDYVLEVPTAEADDTIAVIATHRSANQLETTVYSTDSDYLMLADEYTNIYDPVKSWQYFPLEKKINSKVYLFDSKEEYKEYGILTGQGQKDNIYNIKTASDHVGKKPGLGPVAAMKLLEQPNTMEVIERNGWLKNYQRNAELIDILRVPDELKEIILIAYENIIPTEAIIE